MRYFVSGGKNFDDEQEVFDLLDRLAEQDEGEFVVINTGEVGAASLSSKWALRRKKILLEVPGKEGPRGVAEIVEKYEPDLVICFDGDEETAIIAEIVKEMEIPLIDKNLEN
jgi:hypothetical protein